VEGFYQTYFDLIETIEESIQKKRIVPALILIYSGIDSFSYLSEVSDQKGRGVFKAWVKKWMLGKYSLPCNEVDLYAARCGLLHRQMSEAQLTEDKNAKELYYAWGNKDQEELQKGIDSTDKKDQAVAINIEDLVWSFRKGIADCMDEIKKDERWDRVFKTKAGKLFVSVNL